MKRALYIALHVIAWALMLAWAAFEPVDIVERPIQGGFPF